MLFIERGGNCIWPWPLT